MITAVDSNVLIDVLGGDPQFGPASRSALRSCLNEGIVIACDVVWAEIIAAFPDPAATKSALARLPIEFSGVNQAAATAAGLAWRGYRRAGGPRERLVADFVVGAHALEQADRLLTRDRGFQRAAFARLAILDPSR
ncbi:MAG: type II toxin-antitoxin system VapC family toxin [Chloroflexota bacterium]